MTTPTHACFVGGSQHGRRVYVGADVNSLEVEDGSGRRERYVKRRLGAAMDGISTVFASDLLSAEEAQAKTAGAIAGTQ